MGSSTIRPVNIEYSRWRTDPELLDAFRSEFMLRVSYDPESGLLTWLPKSGVDRYERSWNARYSGVAAGKIGRDGYVLICCTIPSGRKRIFAAHRVIWMLHFGEWPNSEVDHINHDRSDNRISNLRLCSRQENCRNSKLSSANKTGATGVHLDASGFWVASVTVEYKQMTIGKFKTMEDAADAARTARSSAGFHENHGYEGI